MHKPGIYLIPNPNICPSNLAEHWQNVEDNSNKFRSFSHIFVPILCHKLTTKTGFIAIRVDRRGRPTAKPASCQNYSMRCIVVIYRTTIN